MVVVGDKAYLAELVAKLDEHEINFDIMTLDWFALNKYEVAVLDSSLLINDDHFQGALSTDLADFYLNQLRTIEAEHFFHVFTDSSSSLLIIKNSKPIDNKEVSFIWLARRLQRAKIINLCQGELEHEGSKNVTRRWSQAAVVMSLIWFLSLLGSNAIRLYYLNKDTAVVDTQIATIYHQFFPKAQQVISPKFRISQLLKANQSSTDTSFWVLLNALAKASKNTTMNFEQIRFQNQTLLVTLTTKNFEELEDLQTHLQKTIKVRQTQASTENEKVVGTLELSL